MDPHMKQLLTESQARLEAVDKEHHPKTIAQSLSSIAEFKKAMDNGEVRPEQVLHVSLENEHARSKPILEGNEEWWDTTHYPTDADGDVALPRQKLNDRQPKGFRNNALIPHLTPAQRKARQAKRKTQRSARRNCR